MSVLTDVAWSEYERDGDKVALATKHALFFRSIFMPSLAASLTQVLAGDVNALSSFADCLQRGLKKRLVRQPAAMHSLVQTIVLAKHA
jgi:hypothetical protein